jgi:hypothetical protein
MVSPDPLHSLQGRCICWIIEGPSCLIETFMPLPWQTPHLIDPPDFDPFLLFNMHCSKSHVKSTTNREQVLTHKHTEILTHCTWSKSHSRLENASLMFQGTDPPMTPSMNEPHPLPRCLCLLPRLLPPKKD